ncbi:heme NO binding associated [Necator americanus]|uniref:guanylate cyclase n=1 Tax=Necator americanus TaxID=51031 RepID=W2SG44_NECAM|nr:heme NO binding associated [Necator americanus]ETN68594.1 heme NO binding associated [Necator americanus]
MIGWTHVCISTLIIRRYGIEIWQQILKKAGFTECTEFEVQCYYDDSETMRIFRTAAGILGLSVDDMWEVYGEFLITYACETGWEKMLACMANNLQEFLDNLNSMHYFIDQIAFKSEMRGPTFQCESVGEGSLRLHYFSHRQGLFPIVKGLVRRTARLLFDMDVKVNVVERTQERRKSGMVEHVVFSLEPDDQHRSGTRLAYKFKRINRRSSGDAEACDSNLSLALNLRDFARIFPYHICFNKQMVVEHVGKHLCQEYGLADKKMLKVTELVQLIQPADIQQLTPKSIMTYLNTLFIFQLKHHCKRNEIEKDSSEAFQQPLCLKGQMMPINGGNSIIFLCSPHVTSVRDILNLKLFISDMPMHDATRDLVMLNQSRICQMELNKRLEETVRKLKGLAEELAKKKQQTEHLLYQFVPVEVADSLRLGKPIPPRETKRVFDMVLCVPGQPKHEICVAFFPDEGDTNLSTTDVIDVIAKLFKQFDRLIQKLQCYKVLSLMDSYLVVSGAPNPSDCHAENMLNLAIGFVFSGRSIVVPGMNLPVRVRVGISCGPIVAGVVSHEKPRYCIFGQTVNIAKEIRSLSLPGRILLSNVVKTTVSKNQKSFFKFQQHQTVEVGNIKMLTHFLEKNEKLSVWEISDIEKGFSFYVGPTDSIDGYKELHSAEGAELWESAKNVVLRKQQVIDAFRPGPSRTRRALTRLQSVKRKFRAAQSNDSGVSMSEPNVESVVCSVM